MGRGWHTAFLTFAVLTANARGDERHGGEQDRWSKPATPERRQGDWVPLSCANCHPIQDQGVQGSNSLPSVLTPPPRVEEARLLPPPPPPDGLFQQAATGFLQTFTQQQPPSRKPQQFLQETSQTVNRPQAQFLKSNNVPVNSKPEQQFLQEPSSDFQPPQQLGNHQLQRQPQLLPLNQQQFLNDAGPYLNQQLFLGPQFLAAPFFPQTSIPPQSIQHINPVQIQSQGNIQPINPLQIQPINPIQVQPQRNIQPINPVQIQAQENIQPISPLQVQPQTPISPNVVPVDKQNFRISADRPVFTQQITAGIHRQPSGTQQVISQTSAPQEQYFLNETLTQKHEEEKEEVQLLYVPVETLKQRARNIGRQKSVPFSQQDVTTQVAGTESNRFTGQGQNHQISTRKPHLEDQENFNTQTSKHHYNIKQNLEYQQQLPPEDQEKFNSQTHTIRQQFNVKETSDQFQQQPQVNNRERVKLDTHSTKQQYNFKTTDQYQQHAQPNQGDLDSKLNIQQNGQFQIQTPSHNTEHVQIQAHNINEQQGVRFSDIYHQTPQSQEDFNEQTFNVKQQFNPHQNGNSFQQQLPPVQQDHFNIQDQVDKQQFNINQNSHFHQQQHQQVNPHTYQAQPYINQPLQIDQQLSTEHAQIKQQIPTQQTQLQEFNLPEVPQQTTSPIAQTRAPEAHETYTTQPVVKQRYRNPQQGNTRNVQQPENNQFTRKFPEDYQQQPSVVTLRPSQVQSVDATQQAHTLRNNQQLSWTNHKNTDYDQLNQQDISNQQFNSQLASQIQSGPQQVPSLAPPSSTLPPQTTPAPNQPPLSVYMETTEDTKVNDVLRLLKNAKTIQVLDTVGPDSPQVFVGPSNLKAPSGYIKFELPYLNSLESNRVERKVDRLPFFVAPLNFNPPPGYSKIPFPAPHIGSVVVSNVTVLKTALHEKPYENEPVTISSSERYLDQFTLPAEIAPISPQLPSLINSLQDEIYSTLSSTAFPSTTTETTTTAFTTQSYRGRGSSRGSHRGSSTYHTSASPTRRPQSRTRRPYDGRPYSRRQPITTPTTTIEPSTEASVQQQFTPQPEHQTLNNEGYIAQSSDTPIEVQADNIQSKVQTGNFGTYYNEQFVNNNFNVNQFPSQQQHINQPIENQNFQQAAAISDSQNIEQYHHNQPVTQNNYAVEAVAHTTAVPTVAIPSVQEEPLFKNQQSSGSRRDSTRHHQRFRGRQRLTTTTTEIYEEPVHPVENHFKQQEDSNLNYQNIQSRQQLGNQNQNRLVENTHFQANVPENKYSIQTERADTNFQTTERLLRPQNEEHIIQQNAHNDDLNSHLTIENQFQQQGISQVVEPDVHQVAQQHRFQQSQFPQLNANLEHSNFNTSKQHNKFDYEHTFQQNPPQYTVNQFKPVASNRESLQQNINPEEAHTNLEQINPDQIVTAGQVLNHAQENYLKQLALQNQQEGQSIVQGHSRTQNQQQYNSEKPVFQLPQETVRDLANINLKNQHISTSAQFEQVSEVTSPPLQEEPRQPLSTETSNSQLEEEPQIQQYNQQRLVKYSRPHNRAPATVDTQTEDQTTNFRRGQYQTNVDGSDTSTTEEGTTKASFVRVRGRVRSRQRGSTRNYQSTTTEEPNYPTTYLSRQRNNQEREPSQNYVPRKRINYNTRQSYSVSRNNNNNGDVSPSQSVSELDNANTEKQPIQGRITEYAEVSTTTTTTTEASTTNKPARRYQHILNRNKIRRTRPTNAPSSSGSSGTNKFLLPTTPPPVTRLSNTRGRIRKPIGTTTTTSTTEYPQINPSWHERDNFAPSAGSNEILEPLYQTRDKTKQSFGFQRTPVAPIIPQKTSPTPAVSSDDEFWNQPVTIQQSTSFDFKPDGSPVTPPSFQANNAQFQGTFSPIWDGQIELQDGNYYDVFNQRQLAKDSNDQTPFSSDQQKVVYKEIKSRRPIGKENQYTEKTYEIKRPSSIDEDEIPSNERVYPVYRELIKPAETIQDETSQVFADPYEAEGKNLHEKDNIGASEQQPINTPSEEIGNSEIESETKDSPIKRKISATHPGKKGGRRRGSWVRVRVRKPQDMFETAESQNLASLSENAIQAVTKTLNDRVAWTPEPSTELPQTTTNEAVSEPSETINFEEALKDMLKDFITNPEEQGNKEETETATSTIVPDAFGTTNTSVSIEEQNQREREPEVQTYNPEINNQEVSESKPAIEDDRIKQDDEPVKTVLPEITTESFTQEPTTLFQTVENAETTLESEVSTSPNEQVYKTHHSRVLGTSTTTEISLETEICYRGRCVKTKKADSDSDLLTTE